MKCHGDKSLLQNLPIRQGEAIDPILVVTITSSQTDNSGLPGKVQFAEKFERDHLFFIAIALGREFKGLL